MKKHAFTLAEGATHGAKLEKMKKYAFTLAEVLITLGIIGVVAAITMPVLIQNYQKHVYVTGAKKAVNVITNMFQKEMANNEVSSILDTSVIQEGCLVNFGEDGYGNSILAPDMAYTQEFPINCAEGGDGYGSSSKLEEVISKNIKTTKISICSNEQCRPIIKPTCNERICCQRGCPSNSNYSYDILRFGYESMNWVVVHSADGVIYYFVRTLSGLAIAFDTNGKKGPNQEGKDFFCLTYVNGMLLHRNCNYSDYGKNPELSHLGHLMNNGWNMDY